MRALITGINGFVGGHLAEHLLAETSWELAGAVREPALVLPNLQGRVRPLSIDLQNAEAVRAAIADVAPDIIFHLAAQAHAPTSFRDPGATLTGNILMQLNILEAVRAAGIDPTILVVGTGEEYGAVQPEEIPVDEDTPLRPVSPYGVSKVAQDMLAFQYHAAYKLKTIRVRPFNHTGPRQEPRYVATEFAQQIARIEAGQQPPTVRVGNLEARRDFTDVRDVVRAYRLAVEHGQPGAVYNIGSGQPVAIAAILETLVGLSHVPIDVQHDPARMRPADVPVIACDARRFRQQTGWEPRISLRETLTDILNDFRQRVAAEA